MAPAEPEHAQPRESIEVEVAIGLAPRQVRTLRLTLPAGSTLRQAIEASGLMQEVPDLNPQGLARGMWHAGVWGRRQAPGHVLLQGDRVELVRGLQVDPKEARRVRYRAQGEKLPKGFHRASSARSRQEP
jgi:putative ubiquitin-RnfH superfamily antitoxin RatB of RatAB toxin-antitoxin module